jgi:hypothetical protein
VDELKKRVEATDDVIGGSNPSNPATMKHGSYWPFLRELSFRVIEEALFIKVQRLTTQEKVA